MVKFILVLVEGNLAMKETRSKEEQVDLFINSIRIAVAGVFKNPELLTVV